MQPTLANEGKPRQNVKKPKILVLTIGLPQWYRDVERQLSSAMNKNAIVENATTPDEVVRQLSAKPAPSAVLVMDTTPVLPQGKHILKSLIAYAKGGGRVVLCGMFNLLIRPNDIGPFFAKWGLPWTCGGNTRTTFTLNPAGVPKLLNPQNLFPTYSMDAVSVMLARKEEIVYANTPESFIETPGYRPTLFSRVNVGSSPVVLGRVGKGYLGFIGDKDYQQETTHVILEMCGIKWTPGDLGERVGFRPNGEGVEATDEIQVEMRVLMHVTRIRPRETEVAARRVKRAAQARVKQASGDRLKDQVTQTCSCFLLR